MTLRQIYTEAQTHGQAFENLRVLVSESPGRLSGSKSLEHAVDWAEQTLNSLHLDRVYLQDVLVPHWERGAKETVMLLPPVGTPGQPVALTAAALGGSVAGDVTAEVVKVNSIEELARLGEAKVAGKVVFFNRAMDPRIPTGPAYLAAVDQRKPAPELARRLGAVAFVSRSITCRDDDFPHAGTTTRGSGNDDVPAAVLSMQAADKLASALASSPRVRIALKINSTWFDRAPSHNVIGEIQGSDRPGEIILVGGHLDSWDISPGAQDDGSGVVQSIEVLRLFRALGLKPRHTLRCVLFTNEENGGHGALIYDREAKAGHERHILAIERDSGGFAPSGFTFGSTQGDVHQRASRWRTLFAPYGMVEFTKGSSGADVTRLMLEGVTVANLATSLQGYFDYHHTANDTIDKVNPRDLESGAAALASLIWLVDRQGL